MYDTAFVLNSIALGIGLAMDAFSVSLANGLREPSMTVKRTCAVASVYALFQYAMPMLGWIFIHTIAELFLSVQPFIPLTGMILLLFLGIKMIFEGIRSGHKNNEDGTVSLTVPVLLLQGTATSIDALSVGFTTAGYNLAAANLSSVIIGLVTFIICVGGLKIGHRAGTKLSSKASILGGIILITIGLKIFFF
ncbi:MAG: manganese efflux pump MntP family protein [Lachnospiraceae bacterium]|nr:manganese efflux pump MntP family protein [Lachnospiraceae bacterium]